MKVGIVGKGSVAQALFKALSQDHSVRLGVRTPDGADEGPIGEVAEWADAVVLATPWRAEPDVAKAIAPFTDGKPVLDATNPVGMADHGPDLATDGAGSAAQQLQARLPKAHVVKAFNQIGAEFMADPSALAVRPVMFAAGDDDAAKATALQLMEDAGFEAVDAGPLAFARHLESLAILWIGQAVKGPLGRSFGFALSHNKT